MSFDKNGDLVENVVKVIICDECEGLCSELHRRMTEQGDEMACFCCVCAYKDAPKNRGFDLCDTCRNRQNLVGR